MIRPVGIAAFSKQTMKILNQAPRIFKSLLKIFHQNIRGLKLKVDELSNSLFPDYPHIMCLTEHHLKDYKIYNLPIDHFKLGSKFCRNKFKN
jgi:hypothetical protein